MSTNVLPQQILQCTVYSTLLYCFRTKWVKTKGNEYKHGVGIMLGVDDDDLPQIGCIQDVYVIDNDKVLFSVKKFSTTYEPHFRAYVLHEEDVTAFLYLTDVFVRTPVYIRTSRSVGSNKFVILPHALCAQV